MSGGSADPTRRTAAGGETIGNWLNQESEDVRASAELEGLTRSSERRRGWLVRRMLLVADVGGLAVAFLLADVLFGSSGGNLPPVPEYFLFLATLPVWVIGFKLYGLYDKDEERTDHSTVDEVVTLVHAVTIGAWVLVLLTWVAHLGNPDIPKLVTFWLTATVLVAFGRSAARAYSRRTPAYIQNTVILGTGGVGEQIARKLAQHPEYGIRLMGFVDSDGSGLSPALRHLPVIGPPHMLSSIVREFGVERVIIAYPKVSHEETLELVYSLKELDIQVDIVPRLHDLMGPGAEIHTVEGLPLVGLPPFRLSWSSAALKRAFDIAIASVVVLLAWPVFLAIGVAIKLGSRGPILFKQIRRGANESTFWLYKYRTMDIDADVRKAEVAHLNKHLDADPRMFKIERDPRVTRVGRFLRRYSLDEFPQVINVLKGEMSLVGPRPLILDEDRHVQDWARRRLALKPGMTGLWQVLGRHTLSFEEMVKLDYLYVLTWSFDNDLRIILRTLPILFKGGGGTY